MQNLEGDGHEDELSCGASRYEDGGRVRPVLYRASTVEIIVPYGDPREQCSLLC